MNAATRFLRGEDERRRALYDEQRRAAEERRAREERHQREAAEIAAERVRLLRIRLELAQIRRADHGNSLTD